MAAQLTAVVPWAESAATATTTTTTSSRFASNRTASTNGFQWSEYSSTKFLALHAYCEHVSGWRVAVVLILMPVPALIGSVIPLLVPLNNPLLGYESNQLVMLHGALVVFLMTCGVLLLTLGATSTPRHVYPDSTILLVAVLASAGMPAFDYVLFSQWRFPAPFLILLTGPVWILMVSLIHVTVLRHKFVRFPRLAASLKRYQIPLCVQTSQLGVYAGLTVIFDKVSTLNQVILIVLFPVVKWLFKRTIRHFTRALDEMGAEVSISTVEICGSLYQAMIMQTTPSTLALCAIMAVDAVQGFLSIRFFMGRHLQTPRREVLMKAVEILKRCEAERANLRRPSNVKSNLSQEDTVVVTEALELASAADRVLLVEYFEVSVPVVAALFLLLAYRTTSVLFNTRLNRFYDNSELVASATQSVLLYSLLQGLSVVMFHFVLRWRYNISAMRHLAFVLEYHMRSIQGKLLVFFPVIFYFTLIHYGTDFTLRFDFKALMSEMTIPSVKTP